MSYSQKSFDDADDLWHLRHAPTCVHHDMLGVPDPLGECVDLLEDGRLAIELLGQPQLTLVMVLAQALGIAAGHPHQGLESEMKKVFFKLFFFI